MMPALRCRRLTLTVALLAAVAAASTCTADPPRPHVPNRILVRFRPAASDDAIHAVLNAAAALSDRTIPGIEVRVLELPSHVDDEVIQHALAQMPGVAFAELDAVFEPADVIANDPSYAKQWHLPRIAAPTAWMTTTGSAAVTIAILDTGCDATHPDLAPRYVPGWNTYDGTANTADVLGHGTQVAGAAAAAGNNGIGVSGVVWDCRIMPVRISDLSGYATASAAASGLIWASDRGARVANISYQVTGSATVASGAQYFQSHGGVVTVAAGNGGTFDATLENAAMITVSGTDSRDALASWSNTGNCVDVAAPGASILTTTRGGGYGTGSGTSFAAPVAAGVAALIVSANPLLSPAQVQAALCQSCDDLGAAGWDVQYGWGRVNAASAVALAARTQGVADFTAPTVSIASPSGSATVAGAVTVQMTASDNVSVASVALSVDGALLGTLAAAPYALEWNTTAEPDGNHVLKAVATDSSGNTASAQVTVAVQNTVDTAPPTVAIVSPASGSTVGNPLAVTATAADNVAVTKVELLLDGKVAATDAAVPYAFSLNTKKWTVGLHTLQCRAYDAVGNSTLSSAVTVVR